MLDFTNFTSRTYLVFLRVRPIICRRPIPDTIGRSYTDNNTDTGLYNFFIQKMRFCAGYRRVQAIYMYAGYMRKNTVYA